MTGLSEAARPARGQRTLAMSLDLLLMLAWREIAIKYKQSVMGFFWAIFMPCLIVAAGVVIRAVMARLSGTTLEMEQIAGIMVKSLPWAMVVSAIRFSTSSLTANSNLVTRANCPRIVFPLASTLSALFDFAIALLPLAVLLAVVGVKVTPQMLWVVPLLVVLTVLVAALGVVLATANLFYRDVKYIVEVLLTFAIFFTPVFYDSAMLGEWGFWVQLNPVSPLLEGLHAAVVLGRMPDLPWIAYSTAVTLALAVGAWLMFRRLEPVFADCI